MKRRMTEVSTRFCVIPVKVGEVGEVGVDRALFAKVKPEFDACVRAAGQCGVMVREVMNGVMVCCGREWREE